MRRWLCALRPTGVWSILSLWTIAWALLHFWRAAVSWHFFDRGAGLLLSPTGGGGLHLYANHPGLQIGPLALLVAEPLRHADAWHGRYAAVAFTTALGPLLLGALRRYHPVAARATDEQLLAVGLVVLAVWSEVASHYAHLDDALALTLAVGTLIAVARGNAIATGLLLAAAIDAKPWAAAFVPLLLALPRPGWRRAAWAAAAGVALVWLPFFVAAPDSLRVAQYTIPNVGSSALRALGIHAARTPWWDRPAQLFLGLALGALAVRRHRWPAVLLVAVAVRILLDPETYAYYTSGLVLAAGLVDLLLTRRRLPLFALSAVVTVYLARAAPLDQHALGQLRAAYCLAALGFVTFGRLELDRRRIPARTAGPPCDGLEHAA